MALFLRIAAVFYVMMAVLVALTGELLVALVPLALACACWIAVELMDEPDGR